MLYVTFETMEHKETTILAKKSTILDGRRRRHCRRRGNVESKPPQPPSWGWGSGWGLSSAILCKIAVAPFHTFLIKS